MVSFNELAKRVVAYLVKQDIIESGQEEIYIYGFQRMFIDIIHMVSILFIGFLFREVVGVLGFFTAFRLLRSYAGGYHASTQGRCYILTMFIIIISLSTIKYITINMVLALILWLLFGIVIFLWAPVEAENKPLEQMEIEVYGRRAKQIWCLETICFAISLASNWESVYEGILLASICTGLSLMMAKIEK